MGHRKAAQHRPLLAAAGALLAPLVLACCGAQSAAAPGGWHQTAALQGADTSAGDQLGTSVAVAGTTAVVGAPSHASEAGAAYVFTLAPGGGWKQSAELQGSDVAAFDQFGSSVAVSGRTIVVGAPYPDGEEGRAYVFQLTAAGWEQTAELKGADTAAYDEFGSSVAVSGGTVVVGAGDADLRTGRAYVFQEAAGHWRQVAELDGPGTAPSGQLGCSVAVDGNTIVAGAENAAGTGRAYVFREEAGRWDRVAVLVGKGSAADDYFGSSVAVSGGTVVVGAYGHRTGTGVADVFVAGARGWTQAASLTGSGTLPGDYFGSSVAVDGRTIAVSAEYHGGNTGSVYLFTRSGRAWTQTAVLEGSGTVPGDAFGSSVAVSGATVVVGADDHASKAGELYVFGT